jgi:hypothetical protein
MIRTPELLGGEGTFFTSVNDLGQIIGYYVTASHITNGFVEFAGGYATGDNPNGIATYPYSINDLGIAVGSYLDAHGVFHSYLYDNGFSIQDDANAGTGFFEGTVARSINILGDIVGVYVDSNGVLHGYEETGATFGGTVNFNTVDNTNAGTAAGHGTILTSINNAGQIVGYYIDSNGVDHGISNISGSYVTSDDQHAGTAAGEGTIPTSINSAGQIVGYYIDSSHVAHGFIFTNGVFITGDDPNAGTTAGEGTYPTSINNAGDVVGYYIDSNGVAHGYVDSLSSSVPVVTITSHGGQTSQPVQMISGTVDVADAGTFVTVLDGSTALGSTIVQPDGNWSFGVTLSGNSTHAITADVTNVFGTGTSSAVTYTLNPSAPSAGILESLTPAEEISAIYVGYFNRAPDPGGFTFWEGQYVNAIGMGQSTDQALTNISNSFAPQPETLALYPFLGSGPLSPSNPADVSGVETLVSNIYENLFNRTVNAATDGGATYWVNNILGGTVGLGQAILLIANGATGADAQTVMEKVVVGDYFASVVATLSPQPPIAIVVGAAHIASEVIGSPELPYSLTQILGLIQTHDFFFEVVSDIRLKRDIVEVGRLDNGVGLYRYRYQWSDQTYVGVMAQEVAQVVPDAVMHGGDGYLRVDYGRLGLRLMTWDEWVASSSPNALPVHTSSSDHDENGDGVGPMHDAHGQRVQMP